VDWRGVIDGYQEAFRPSAGTSWNINNATIFLIYGASGESMSHYNHFIINIVANNMGNRWGATFEDSGTWPASANIGDGTTVENVGANRAFAVAFLKLISDLGDYH
jgi:hypothetical protein